MISSKNSIQSMLKMRYFLKTKLQKFAKLWKICPQSSVGLQQLGNLPMRAWAIIFYEILCKML